MAGTPSGGACAAIAHPITVPNTPNIAGRTRLRFIRTIVLRVRSPRRHFLYANLQVLYANRRGYPGCADSPMDEAPNKAPETPGNSATSPALAGIHVLDFSHAL